MRTLARFLEDESGITSIKYGLIAACISVAIVTVLQGIGPKLKNTLIATEDDLN